MSKRQKAQQPSWKNRIVGTGLVDAAELLANPRNWRLHPDNQREALDKVLGTVGWVQNVIVNRRTGFVVDGHLRADLAISKGEKVPVQYVDLAPEEESLILATFDRLTAMAGVDSEKLSELVEEAAEAFPDIQEILTGIDDLIDPEEPGGGLTDDDATPEVPASPVTALGDCWRLGAHRLVCGDSTNVDTVDQLMAGEKAEASITDPPYNVGFEYGDSVDDEKTSHEYVSWTRRWFAIARSNVLSCVVLTSGITNLPMWIADIEKTHKLIAWIKENQCSRNYIGATSGFNTWEPILVYGKAKKCIARDSFSIPIHIQSDTGNHPCPKSIKAWSWLIERFTDEGDLLYEPFSGSGTTIISSEKLNRRCYAVELEPRFVDLCVRRWQDFTGKRATLEGDGRTFAEISADRQMEAAA